MITQVFRVIFFIIGAVAVLFTGNAFLGSEPTVELYRLFCH